MTHHLPTTTTREPPTIISLEALKFVSVISPPPNIVISTEAVHSRIVNRAVERPPYLLLDRSANTQMTPSELESLKRFEGQRVRMTFADGEEIVATLFSITADLDESQHLIYEKVEQSTIARPHLIAAGACYSPGEELISCVLEPLD